MTSLRPDAASLSHHGVTFLDELPEFNRHTRYGSPGTNVIRSNGSTRKMHCAAAFGNPWMDRLLSHIAEPVDRPDPKTGLRVTFGRDTAPVSEKLRSALSESTADFRSRLLELRGWLAAPQGSMLLPG